jgi:hypothetical protein
VWLDVHLVERGKGIADGVVAAGTNVFDESGNGLPKPWCKDVVKTAAAQLLSLILRQRLPLQTTQNCIHFEASYPARVQLRSVRRSVE